MGNIFHPDLRDFLEALNNNKVDYILIGGYAVILHGYNRTTGDLDIWVRRSKENYFKLQQAFEDFRMPVFDMTEKNFLDNPDFNVFTFGVPPVCIDILIDVKGLEFESAFKNSITFDYDNLTIRLIDYRDLITSKKTIGRNKDKDDIENLNRE